MQPEPYINPHIRELSNEFCREYRPHHRLIFARPNNYIQICMSCLQYALKHLRVWLDHRK